MISKYYRQGKEYRENPIETWVGFKLMKIWHLVQKGVLGNLVLITYTIMSPMNTFFATKKAKSTKPESFDMSTGLKEELD